jgi:hypothetical protein
MKRSMITFGLVLLVAAMAAPAASANLVYNITFTNATRGQVVTPPVVIVHNLDYQLFTLGMPASPELTALAEDGVTDDLVAALEADPNVFDYAVADAGLMPGESVTLQVEANSQFHEFSACGMLATTNDGFFALNGIQFLPPLRHRTLFANVYDAGSEENNENCDYIPGPPCGNPMVRATEGAEGFVSVHSGIYGKADLDPATFDWRNPAVKVQVEKQ